MNTKELGCGLIAIGRSWGTTPTVPTEREALHFLAAAYESGIRFFDTAPSYGLSESRLGMFLQSLTPEERKGVRVATKFGEHWDTSKQDAYVDYSLDSLKRSLDQSLNYLGSISILQLHKTTAERLASDDVAAAFAYAEKSGVKVFGASVSDPDTAKLALRDPRLGAVQLPYNRESTQFKPAINNAHALHKELLINRPLQMGRVAASVHSPEERREKIVGAFQFILQEDFDGIILTGTSNADHLRENVSAFQLALDGLR